MPVIIEIPEFHQKFMEPWKMGEKKMLLGIWMDYFMPEMSRHWA